MKKTGLKNLGTRTNQQPQSAYLFTPEKKGYTSTTFAGNELCTLFLITASLKSL